VCSGCVSPSQNLSPFGERLAGACGHDWTTLRGHDAGEEDPMTAKKPSAHTPLRPMPLSELRMMKALLATSPSRAGDKTTRKPATKDTQTTDPRTLRLTIIDKLQVIALRRPRALIILAEVLDELLGQHLQVLDEHPDSEKADRRRTKTRVGRGAPRRDRGDGR
jgi:hypothetical protein